MIRKQVVLSLAFALPCCATIIEGTGQSVAVATDPSGAMCHVARNGASIGDINTTPGSVRVDKSKEDLTFTCSKEGYRTATPLKSPNFIGATSGNLVLGGLVGASIDAATGATTTTQTMCRSA